MIVLCSITNCRAVRNPLRARRATYEVAEPMVRFYQLVIAPNEARLGRRLGEAVWAEVAATVRSRIYGPHLETLAREWVAFYASPETTGGPPARVGRSGVPCPEHRVRHKVDVVTLSGDRVVSLGEVKTGNQPVSVDQLSRLVHLRDLLPRASGARMLLFSLAGFDHDLRKAAGQNSAVELVDLERLYTGS